MISGVLFDLDGTLVNPIGAAPEGVSALVEGLQELGFKLAVLTNREHVRAQRLLDRAGLPPLPVFARDRLGVQKMSGDLHKAAATALGLSMTETVSVGDTRQDSIAAINAGVLPLGAKWGGATPPYALGLGSPKTFLAYAREVLRIDPKWYWSLDGTDIGGRPVQMRALLQAGDGQTLYPILLRVLKKDADPKEEGANFRKFLVAYLTSMLYQEGALRNIKFWAGVPPSSSSTARRGISDLTELTSDFFRISHVPGLLDRHGPARKSAYARARGEKPTFDNQTRTLILDRAYINKLTGTKVLVSDDFITSGLSMEASRNFLVAGGASHVLAVAVGRFGRSPVKLWSPKSSVALNPWEPCNLGSGEFDSKLVDGSFDPKAVTQFEGAWSGFVDAVT